MTKKFFGLLAVAVLISCSKRTFTQPAPTVLIEDRILGIPGEAFDQYLKNAKSKCTIDTGSISGTDYVLKTECKDVCSTYLTNRNTRVQTELSCTYDQGIREVLFSPSCKKLLTYAGYDTPDCR